MDNLQKTDKEFCNLIHRIREDVRFKQCNLNKDELTQLKNDLLTFVYPIAQGSWQKTEYINTTASVPRGLWLKLDTLPQKRRLHSSSY